MAVLTVAQILNIASVSEYLSYVDIAKKGLYGGGMDLELPEKIYNIRKGIAYWYAINPSDTSLVSTSNYLYAICGKYGSAAQAIILNAGTVGGTVSAVAPSPYNFFVDASTSFIIDGQSAKTITAFIGWNLIFNRSYIPQGTVDPGGGASWYSWTKETGSFVCYPAAVTSEYFQLIPV